MTTPAHERRRFRRRSRRHVFVAVVVLGVGLVVGVAFGKDFRTEVSAATAYVALCCVALSLMIGPVNALRGRVTPVSSDLRRDLGIWGGFVGLLHVGVGLTVHFRGRMYEYFFAPSAAHAALPIRLDVFGAANYFGLIGGGILLILLSLSNDLALRQLGAVRWKRWQRLNYAGAIAILVHGALYQTLERRQAAFVAVFLVIVLTTVGIQGLRARMVRRKRSFPS